MIFTARALLIVGCALFALVAFGANVASADPYVGKTYAEASGRIAEQNGTPVVATVSGSQLTTDECIVVSWSKSIFRDSSGDSRRKEFLLNLNCNRALAAPGHPGGSLMTPEGRQSKKDEASAAQITKNPAICDRSDNHAKWCARVCTETGLCEFEI
ncbi:MAG: hypothetical protein K0Q46_5111 [Rhodococcus erythropolis]|jgi:hypothetical protein|nr:hypothetical protein [Rhodococcus erythropolis]MDF2898325.1 hypothetical protein [Rhodococcus erythropolis]